MPDTQKAISAGQFYTVVGILVTAGLTLGGTQLALIANGISDTRQECKEYTNGMARHLEKRLDDHHSRMNAYVEGGFLPNMEGTEDGNRNESP